MFTLEEKRYLLAILKNARRGWWFRRKGAKDRHDKLIEKLEQMIRNEEINAQ